MNDEIPKRKTLTASPSMKAAARKIEPVTAIAKKPASELRRSTRVGEVYWCAFTPHNWPPEFDDKHLVVIVRGGKKENDVHVVVPLTKQPQHDNPHGLKLKHNPNPGSAPETWAVCNHLYTVASERLEHLRDSKGVMRLPERIHEDDLRDIGKRVFRALGFFFGQAFPKDRAPSEGEASGAPEGDDSPATE